MIQQQNLAQSHILIEHVSSQEPSEDEILHKAEELDIDDLSMVRESILEKMEIYWKAYCNRYKQVYYINLVERKAFREHPISMKYKTLYAKRYNTPVPYFKSYQLQEVITSMNIIQNALLDYERQLLELPLNIVYEESDEESLHGKDSNFMTVQQVYQLQDYKKLLKSQHEAQVQAFRLNWENFLITKKNQLRDTRSQAKAKASNMIRERVEEQIRLKNAHNLQKHKEKLQTQYLKRKIQLEGLFMRQMEIQQDITSKILDYRQNHFKRKKIKKIHLVKEAQIKLAKNQKLDLNLTIDNAVKAHDAFLNKTRHIFENYHHSNAISNRKPIFKKQEQFGFQLNHQAIRPQRAWEIGEARKYQPMVLINPRQSLHTRLIMKAI